MLTPRGDHVPADEHDPDSILALARAEAAAIIEAAEARAAALERDGELRARHHLSEAVRTGRERLARMDEEEREVAQRLAAAQRQLQAILDRIVTPDPTLIDLTRDQVRFGLRAPVGSGPAVASGGVVAVPDRPAPRAALVAVDDTTTVATMVRRAVDIAADRGGRGR